MELDFKSIRALSSPTRLKILKKVMDKESTTTKLSDDLGKSKSTISSHLKELTEAGLLEKDKKEGRRRVVYRPTKKADAIVQGKERKVKFSVASSVLSAAGATVLVWQSFRQKANVKAQDLASGSDSSGQMGAFNAMDAGKNATDAASQAAQNSELFPEEILLMISAGLLTISASTLLYGLALNKLSSDDQDEKVKVK